jgi:hypothetical protein
MRTLLLLCLVASCTDAEPDLTCEPGDGTAAQVSIQTERFTGDVDRRPADAAWVAVRDGVSEACGWQPLSSRGDGRYVAPITHERYSIAIACTEQAPAIHVISRSIDDPLSITDVCAGAPADALHQITAEVRTGQEITDSVAVQPFLRDSESHPNIIGPGIIHDFLWEGTGGSYDLVSFADVDDDPATDSLDGLLIARGLDIATDPVIDINPRTATYGQLGAAATMTGEIGSDIAIYYLTSNGTEVPLGFGGATTAFRTWPADQADPGDAYEVVASADFSSRVTLRFARDPSGAAPALPPAFDPSAALIRRDDNFGAPARFEFARARGTAAAPAASQYRLRCRASDDHSITYDISASWLGDGERFSYGIPALAADPAVPEDARTLAGCSWQVVAVGSTEGLEIDDSLAEIGRRPGAPALLAVFGAERWTSRLELTLQN